MVFAILKPQSLCFFVTYFITYCCLTFTIYWKLLHLLSVRHEEYWVGRKRLRARSDSICAERLYCCQKTCDLLLCQMTYLTAYSFHILFAKIVFQVVYWAHVASPSRRNAGFTFRPNDGKNQSLYFINVKNLSV